MARVYYQYWYERGNEVIMANGVTTFHTLYVVIHTMTFDSIKTVFIPFPDDELRLRNISDMSPYEKTPKCLRLRNW